MTTQTATPGGDRRVGGLVGQRPRRQSPRRYRLLLPQEPAGHAGDDRAARRGRLGDLYGHRRLFLAGIAIFTLSSLACGLANSQALLAGARAAQGLGGAVVAALLALFLGIEARIRTPLMPLGLAVLASPAAARTDSLLVSGGGPLVALNGGCRGAFLVGAAFGAAAALLGAVLLRAGWQAPAGEAAEAPASS